MPLSEHEQRILEEIERRLAEEDPKFARQVAGPVVRGSVGRRARRALAAFLGGFALLVYGLVNPRLLVPLGLAAFAVMLGAVAFVTATLRQVARDRSAAPLTPRASQWLSNWEERWRGRFQRGGEN